jgi:hypothetical protein
MRSGEMDKKLRRMMAILAVQMTKFAMGNFTSFALTRNIKEPNISHLDFFIMNCCRRQKNHLLVPGMNHPDRFGGAESIDSLKI